MSNNPCPEISKWDRLEKTLKSQQSTFIKMGVFLEVIALIIGLSELDSSDPSDVGTIFFMLLFVFVTCFILSSLFTYKKRKDLRNREAIYDSCILVGKHIFNRKIGGKGARVPNYCIDLFLDSGQSITYVVTKEYYDKAEKDDKFSIVYAKYSKAMLELINRKTGDSYFDPKMHNL